MMWRFLPADLDRSNALLGDYEGSMVALSVAVSIIAAYAALEAVERATAARQRKASVFWVGLGAVCLGFGVWSMHFLGMIGFRLPIPVHYEPGLTALSALPGLIASTFALAFLATRTNNLAMLLMSGVLIAVGIGTMHYTGMEAMHAQGVVMWYDATRFTLSILIAVLLAISALFLKRTVAPKLGLGPRVENALGGVVLGIAVSSMHYVAMTATWFLPSADVVLHVANPVNNTFLAVGLAAAGIAIALIVIISVLIDRRLRYVDITSELVLVPGVIFVLIAVLAYVSVSVMRDLEERAEQDVLNSLKTVLNTTHEALTGWRQQHITAARVWADSEVVRLAAAGLVKANKPEEMALDDAQEKLRIWFISVELWTDYREIFLIDREGWILASSHNQRPDRLNVFLEQPDFLEEIWSGEPAVSLPMPSDVPLLNESGAIEIPYPTMFVGAPVFGTDGRIIAALTLRLDPMGEYSRLLQQGRIGESGQTYAIDRHGLLLSESRFTKQLKRIGMVAPTQRAMLNLYSTNPGADLVEGQMSLIAKSSRPLTLMAAQVSKGVSGSDVDGYRDFRGVPVVGAWLWDDEARMGLAIEQSVEDAKRALLAARNVVVGLTMITATLLFLLALLLTLARGRRLETARRTAAILETTADGILTWSYTGIIESCNRSGRAIFGDGPVLGEPLKKLLPDMAGQSYQDVRGILETPKGEPVNVRMEVSGWRYDQSRFPLEISLSETIMPSGEQLFTGIFRDITERKRIESELVGAISEQERLGADLSIARDIQRNMLPVVFPPFPDRLDVEIYAALSPAYEVGGDFYDFFELGGGRICFAIGDVSGKGIPAALFMAIAKTLLESRVRDSRSPGEALTRLNQDLSKRNEANMFVTLFVAILDPATGVVTYSNGGHNPPYVLTDSGELIRLEGRHGPVVGVVADVEYGTAEIKLSQGDTLFMYTDGVTEAMNAERKLYGEEQLESVLASLRYESATQIVKTFIDQIARYEGEGADQTDDITLQAVRLVHDKEESKVLVLELTLENRLEEITRLNERFDEIATKNGISLSVSQKFNIIFDELLSNIVYYGDQNDNSARIRIRIEMLKDRIKVAISSSGLPFDPNSANAPDLTQGLEDRELGGLGIHIVKSLVDEMTYHRRIGQNVINLLMYLDKNEAES